MVEDLAAFSMHEIESAIKAWRNDPKARFFPTSGQLMQPAREERAEIARATNSKGKLEFGDSRPIMWWTLPKNLWQPHWKDYQIPAEYRQTHDILQNRARPA